MKSHILAIAGFSFLALGCWRSDGQERMSMPKLFRELQSEGTTNQALGEFLLLAPDDSAAKRYLALHLPALISEKSEDHPHVWLNAMKLAGAFRTSEAIPALVKWIGTPASESGEGTLAERVRLEPFPAAKTLAQIGEPAVPALANALEEGNARERPVSFRALLLVGSPSAIRALRDHLNREPDQSLKLEIQKALESS